MDKKNIGYLAYTYEKNIEDALKVLPKKNTFYMTDHEFLDLFKNTEGQTIEEQVLEEEEVLNTEVIPLEDKNIKVKELESSESTTALDYIPELKENLQNPPYNTPEFWKYVKNCTDLVKNDQKFLSKKLDETTIYSTLIPYCAKSSNPEDRFTELLYGLWGLGKIVKSRGEIEEIVKFNTVRTATNVIGRLTLRNHTNLKIIIEGIFRDEKEELRKVEQGKAMTLHNITRIIYEKGKSTFNTMLTTYKGTAPETTQIKAIQAFISAYQDELFKKYL
ncbi:hypothetical protein HY837_04695 [archaeon]|nr:hypothetical protein [archaeon]